MYEVSPVNLVLHFRTLNCKGDEVSQPTQGKNNIKIVRVSEANAFLHQALVQSAPVLERNDTEFSSF